MKYIPITVELLALNQTIPVDVWAPDGRLLLRRGQSIDSDADKDLLRVHKASTTEADARAWQRSHERVIRQLLRDGASVETIARSRLPAVIEDIDYVVGKEVQGGWLDLQELLRGMLYQGEATLNALERLEGIEKRARELLSSEPDECLFTLFQALPDLSLGYCATHALLSAVVCELTAEKLDMPLPNRQVLFRSALIMNIGMARDQDSLASQSTPPNEAQRKLIKDHPERSLHILRAFGLLDEDQLDIVRWHHEQDTTPALVKDALSQRILRTADSFVAKMAPRKTRQAISPLGAAKALFLNTAEDAKRLSSAMTTVIGFYPPGTFVELVNGETAVAMARGLRANTPQVLTIIQPNGMPLSKYVPRDTGDAQFAIQAPINAENIKVKVSLEKVRKEIKALATRLL
jgi:HD-GYP domain-containing protein (c-di-GMP phosphodiesterase class II)